MSLENENEGPGRVEAPSGEDALPPQAAGAAPAALIPPLVIRGERYIGHDPETGEKALLVPRGRKGEYALITLPDEAAHPYGAITDWLNFTFPVASIGDQLGPFFSDLSSVVSSKLAPAVERPSGLYAYRRSFKLGDTKALFCIGGNRDTALVSLPGEVCATVQDWAALAHFGEERLQGRVTRWDGAVDDYLGAHSVDGAIELYRQGLFGSGGRQPRLRQHGNWIEADGSGRSVEIGQRGNGKRLLVYEKGMELGAQFHPWTRWELCLGNTGRIIPWRVLLTPGQYVAGAYPKALSWAHEERSRIPTLQKQTQIVYDDLMRHTSIQCGRVLTVAAMVEGSVENAFKKLSRPGLPRRLQHPAVENPEAWVE